MRLLECQLGDRSVSKVIDKKHMAWLLYFKTNELEGIKRLDDLLGTHNDKLITHKGVAFLWRITCR